MESSLELVTLIKRLRIHGMALRLNLTFQQREAIATFAKTREIEPLKNTEFRSEWDHYEVLTKAEKFFLGFMKHKKRYQSPEKCV